jgi:hypothetical protein
MDAIEKYTKPRIDVIDFENRRYPRFDIHLPIEYNQIKSSVTHIGNISEGGLLIYFPEETDVRQYLKLKLFFSLSSELNTIKVLAEAVWTDNHLSKDREYHPYGVKFVDISPEDGTKLKKFLKTLSSPLDDILCRFNSLKMKVWIWKLKNLNGVIATEKTIEPVLFQNEGKAQKESPISQL